jgi:cytochrome P450
VAYLATDDVEIGGITIPAGDAVIASTAAANRDASVFADPARLDVTRPDISQLGFGHGPHFCLGAHLARLELQVAIATLLTRFPDLRLAVADHEVPWKDGSAVWGLLALPVAF